MSGLPNLISLYLSATIASCSGLSLSVGRVCTVEALSPAQGWTGVLPEGVTIQTWGMGQKPAWTLWGKGEQR